MSPLYGSPLVNDYRSKSLPDHRFGTAYHVLDNVGGTHQLLDVTDRFTGQQAHLFEVTCELWSWQNWHREARRSILTESSQAETFDVSARHRVSMSRDQPRGITPFAELGVSGFEEARSVVFAREPLGATWAAVFDDVAKAVRAAADVQRRFADYNSKASDDIRIRIGIDVGEPVSDHNDLFGVTVQLAFRLCSEAEADGILVSEAVRDLCGQQLSHFVGLGERHLKGFAKSIRVIGTSAAAIKIRSQNTSESLPASHQNISNMFENCLSDMGRKSSFTSAAIHAGSNCS
jgi:hypothetical protein